MGVDFFCSDYPHLAIEAFKKFDKEFINDEKNHMIENPDLAN